MGPAHWVVHPQLLLESLVDGGQRVVQFGVRKVRDGVRSVVGQPLGRRIEVQFGRRSVDLVGIGGDRDPTAYVRDSSRSTWSVTVS